MENRVNHANHFVPRPVQLNAVRPNSNSVRPNVNTVRQNVNSVRSNVNTVRPKQPRTYHNQTVLGLLRPREIRALLLRPQQVIIGGTLDQTPIDHPLKNMEDRGIFDSGCSGHMTGNKDHLDDFEECKGGSVTFGGSKGYITGKGRIRVGNLEFDSVSFVKELGHFNIFSISQICDKQHKIFGNMKRGFRGVPRPLLPAMLPVVAVDQSAGQADQAVTQPSPSEPLPSSSPPPVISATTESEPTPVAESTTHPNSLSPEPDNEPIEHTFEQPSSEHQPLSPRQETEIPQSQDPTHPHVAEERTMTVDDLLQLVPKLITKVDSLEKELKQTKLTMGKAIVKLVKKVKKMEAVLKRRHVVLTDSEDEDAENSSKQGRNLQEEGLDEMVRSIMKDKSEDFETPTQGKTSGEADISPEGLEAAETLAKVLTQRTKTYTRKVKTGLRRKLDADEVNSGDESIIPSPKKGQREGKAVLEEKSQSKRTKKQIREEQASLAEIMSRLSETQKNRMAQVQEAAKYYTEEDWDSVRAKLEANRDLSSKVLSIDFSSDDFAKKMVELINEKKRLYKEQRERDRRNRPMTQAEQREYMIKYLKSQGNNWKIGQLKKLKPDELKEEFDKCVEKVEKFIPMNSELEASKLKRTGINLQAKVFKKQKITDVPDVTKDESVKREEEC
ncbi:hypothetical protein Tco_0411804 [Tanacetum coccineum]